jgi:hypothetical protein
MHPAVGARGQAAKPTPTTADALGKAPRTDELTTHTKHRTPRQPEQPQPDRSFAEPDHPRARAAGSAIAPSEGERAPSHRQLRGRPLRSRDLCRCAAVARSLPPHVRSADCRRKALAEAVDRNRRGAGVSIPSAAGGRPGRERFDDADDLPERARLIPIGQLAHERAVDFDRRGHRLVSARPTSGWCRSRRSRHADRGRARGRSGPGRVSGSALAASQAPAITIVIRLAPRPNELSIITNIASSRRVTRHMLTVGYQHAPNRGFVLVSVHTGSNRTDRATGRLGFRMCYSAAVRIGPPFTPRPTGRPPAQTRHV